MLNSINFDMLVEGIMKPVKLSRMQGGYYHIFIDNFYYGQIINASGQWSVRIQNPEYFSAENLETMVDTVTINEPPK